MSIEGFILLELVVWTVAAVVIAVVLSIWKRKW